MGRKIVRNKVQIYTFLKACLTKNTYLAAKCN